MGFLQSLWEAQLKEVFHDMVMELLEAKFQECGVSLSKRDKRKLRKAVAAGDLDNVRVGGWRWWEQTNVTVEITEGDIDSLNSDVSALLAKLPDITLDVVHCLTPGSIQQILRYYPREMRQDRKKISRFERRLLKQWDLAFRSLSIVIEVATRVGMGIADTALEEGYSRPNLAYALIWLQGRCIRIAKEVQVLLQAGYPDAAMARWRTLHEIAVTACFLSEIGEDCAERYLAHQSVEAYKSAKRYQVEAPTLGFAPLTAPEFAEIESSYRSSLAKYGSAFSKDFGWAAPFLPGVPCAFSSIENAVALSHLRPWYKLASQEVHAGSKGLVPQMAMPPDGLLLLGPSNSGLADPGQNTALSVGLVSSTLLSLAPTMDSLVGTKALCDLAVDTADTFVAIQADIEAEQADA